MVAVELGSDSLEVDVLLCSCIPRQLEDCVYVCLDDARLVSAYGQSLKTRALLHQSGLDLFGELHIGDLLAQLVYIIELAAVAQLLADDVHLLAQEVVSLALVDTSLSFIHDILLDAHDEYLVLHSVDEYLKAVGEVDCLENDLLDLNIKDDIGSDKICKLARLVGHTYLEEYICRQLGSKLHISLKCSLKRAHESYVARSQIMLF